jgi:hypothetical protein
LWPQRIIGVGPWTAELMIVTSEHDIADCLTSNAVGFARREDFLRNR